MADEIDVEALMPPAEPADDTKADDTAEGQPETPKEKTVPLAALHEERALRKQLQAELRETQARLSKVDQIEEALKAMRAEKLAAEATPEPEFVEDPQGYIDRRTQRANEATEAQLKAQREQLQRLETETMANRFKLELKNFEDAYVDEHEDYFDALSHVRRLRAEELSARGYNEDQIKVKIIQDELELAAEAMTKKSNPAEVAYKRALAYGYAPKADEAAAETDTADDRRARVERAQSMGSSNANVDVEALMAAPPDVLDEVFKELKFGNRMK